MKPCNQTLKLVFFSIFTFLSLISCGDPATTTSSPYCSTADCVEKFTIQPSASSSTSSTATVSLYRSYPLTTPISSITRVVIIIHGYDVQPILSFTEAVSIAAATNHTGDTLIIAPWFKRNGTDPLDPNDLSWSTGGWGIGDKSVDSFDTSSYTVMDQIISSVTQTFSSVKLVTLVGMSDGGQYVQRYLGSRSSSANSYHIRFIVASPGSYLYLNNNRYDSGDQTFKHPTNFIATLPSVCIPSHSGYDDYKYGLNQKNHYLNQISDSTLVSNYVANDVIYLVGELDNATSHSDPDIGSHPRAASVLDISCPAELEGNSRLQRSIQYKAFLDNQYSSNQHQRFTISGVGHELTIFDSDIAKKWIFCLNSECN